MRTSSLSRAAPCAAGAAVVWLLVSAAAATGAEPLAGLLGSWRGAGTMDLEDGGQDAITCTARYKPREGDSKLTQELACDSPRYKIDLRSRLSHKAGMLSGGWFEKTREVSGSASGHIAEGSLFLDLKAIGFAATLSATLTSCAQSVELTPEFGSVKRVSVVLEKDGC